MNSTELATLIAAFTALGATFILPVLKNYFGFQTTKLNDVASWREYLAKELVSRDQKIASLEEKITKALEETQKWRDLYYQQLDINNKQGHEIVSLREDNHELNDRVEQLQKLVAKNAGIVQDNANKVVNAMDVAQEEIRKI
jgi:hypothetical protein